MTTEQFLTNSHLPWSIKLDEGYAFCDGVIEVPLRQRQHGALGREKPPLKYSRGSSLGQVSGPQKYKSDICKMV